MDEAGKAWTEERVNDILKAAYTVQTLCRTSRGCAGCPFRTRKSECVFRYDPAVPLAWNIEEKTVYTVKMPDA